MLNHDQTPAYTRSAIQAMARAVDAEPDFAGWLADVLARTAAHAGSADALTSGRPGSWEANLVEQLVRGTVGYGDDEHLPSDGLDGHARPDLADMKTALGLARVILDSADLKTAHEAAEAGSCPACVAVAAMSFGITLASEVGGDSGFVSERCAARCSPPCRPPRVSCAARRTKRSWRVTDTGVIRDAGRRAEARGCRSSPRRRLLAAADAAQRELDAPPG